jgi:toxin ParE1/3/4
VTLQLARAPSMAYEVVFANNARQDFTLIFEFLADSYISFGEDAETALTRAEARVQSIREDIIGLGKHPHCGTLHDEILPGLRHVTIGQAIVWFEIDDGTPLVRILAVFFGGQDHVRTMLIRLLGSN